MNNLESAMFAIGLILVMYFYGCGHSGDSGEHNTTAPIAQEIKKETSNSEKDISELSDEELANQVVEYIKNNPNERIFLTNYALNISTLNPSFVKSEKHQEGNIMINSIPVVGGIISDKIYDKYLESCRKFLLEASHDYEYIKKAAEKYHDPDSQSYAFPGMKPEKISDKVYNEFLNRNIPKELNFKTYMTMYKISELKYRYVEAYIDDNKERMSAKPDIFDFVDEVSYKVFFKEENEKKQKSAKKALKKIYSELWLDSLYNSKNDLQYYYDSKVPKWLFAYELEQKYFPENKDDIQGESNPSKQDVERLYPIINGKWHSLKTGKNIEMNLKVEDFGKTANGRLAASQVNGIYILSKSEPFANLSFWDYENKERKKLLIVPATYIHDNQEENVLVMYVNYEFLGFNSQEKDFGYAQNLRIDNIKTATDVLIKKI